MKTIKNLILFLIVSTLIIIGAALLVLKNTSNPGIPTPKLLINKELQFSSEALGITFDAPKTAKITENVNTINIEINGETIMITRSASYYDSAEEHVAYLEELNNYTFDKIEKVNENILMTQLGDKTMYFQKKGDYIFSISTESTDLYDELESIAYSLK